MKYRKLGRTGYEVSEMAHGSGAWGAGGVQTITVLGALQLATDLGCNFFDTAWAYGKGESDGLLGEILSRNPRKRLYAASKIPPLNRKWPARSAYDYQDVFPAAHVFKHADMIRKKLRADSIDLLQFHVWDDSWTDVAGISHHRGEAQTRRNHPSIWAQSESLGARKRYPGSAHRAGRCGTGDP